MNNVDSLLNDSFVNELEESGSLPKKDSKQKHTGAKSVYDSIIPAYIEVQDFSDEHLNVIQSYIDAHNLLRQDPTSFIPYWEERLKYMKGDFYWYNTLSSK